MREILFKAKRQNWEELPKDKWWVIGYLVKAQHGRYTDFGYEEYEEFTIVTKLSCGGIEFVAIDKDTICQYTGLTDKNGNKIWENDIVEFLGHKGIVKQECGCFGIAFIDSIDWDEIENQILPITGCDNRLYACMNDNFISLWEVMWNFNDEEDSVYTVEVIGNTFDNPELLKGE